MYTTMHANVHYSFFFSCVVDWPAGRLGRAATPRGAWAAENPEGSFVSEPRTSKSSSRRNSLCPTSSEGIPCEGRGVDRLSYLLTILS